MHTIMKNMNDKFSSTLKKGMMLILLAGVSAAPVSAQSLLRGLAGKAVQKVAGKVADKVVDKVSDAVVGKVVGKAVATPASPTVTPVATPDYSQNEGATSADSDEYPERLGPSAEYPGGWSFDINEESVSPLEFKNFADVLKAFPVLPSAAEMINEEAMKGYFLSLAAYNNGISVLGTNRSMLYAEMASRAQNLRPTAIDGKTRDYVGLMAQEMMKLSPEEQAKLAGLEGQGPEAVFAYLKAHHPAIYKLIMEKGKDIKPVEQDIDDERIDQFTAIIDDLEPIVNRMPQDLLQAAHPSLKKDSQIELLCQELLVAWPKSPECAQIKAMQAELDARTAEWDKTHRTGKFTDYPPFWDEERTKQNQIIDAYNLKAAERMRAAVQQAIDQAIGDLKVLADCDVRLEALGVQNDGEAVFCGNVLNSIAATAMTLRATLFPLLSEILKTPLVFHTTLSAEMGQ